MTVTDIRTRTSHPQPEQTPESGRVAELQAMLEDPRWSAHRPEIERAIVYLTATTVLAA